jgi:hypothetical protein
MITLTSECGRSCSSPLHGQRPGDEAVARYSGNQSGFFPVRSDNLVAAFNFANVV